jgi:hypothetical protein
MALDVTPRIPLTAPPKQNRYNTARSMRGGAMVGRRMDEQTRPTISPTPDDTETAAILIALHTYLADTRVSEPARAPQVPIWAIAGRFASQGQTLTYARGARPSWTKISR